MKKNILFLAPFDTKGRYKGGIASFASGITNDEQFKETEIYFDPLSTCQIERDSFSGGRISLKNIKNFFALRKQLSKRLKNGDYTSIYINTSRGFALIKDLLLIKRKIRKKYETIFHIHFADGNEVFKKNKLLRKYTFYLFKKNASKIIVLSYKLKEFLVKNGLNGDKIFVLANYYDNALKIIDCPKKPDVVTYLFVGSVTQRKGIYELLEVFNTLDDSYQLIVCGEPNEKIGNDYIKKYRNKENIIFKGFVAGETKNEIFSSADVFVLPTYSEGLPISLLEAMFFGLACIISSVGAISEIVSDENAILIKPGDKEGLLLAIKKYHNNRNLLLKHQSNNKIESTKYSYEVFKKHLLDILKK